MPDKYYVISDKLLIVLVLMQHLEHIRGSKIV